MAKQNKDERNYKKLVGRIGDDYYFLDNTFEHKDGFKGAVGSVMSPLTENEYNQRVDDHFDRENMREYWRQAVSNSSTDLSLDDWIELVKDTDGEEVVIDRSYPEYAEILKEKLGETQAFEVECIGGGRCFNGKMKWDEVFNEDLLKEIARFED